MRQIAECMCADLMRGMTRTMVISLMLALVHTLCGAPALAAAPDAAQLLARAGSTPGLCVLIGPAHAAQAVPLAKSSGLMLYVQAASPREALAARQAAQIAGLLGRRIFVDEGAPGRIQLASNLADTVFVSDDIAVPDDEILRVLRPGGKAFIGASARELVKPIPTGLDSWSHPYHGPDNNPQSRDQVARYPYLTQFLAEPMFSSQPEVTVAAGGRIFKAFGHMAFKSYQDAMINTLYAFSAYNGTELWRRELHEGFMIHRNTMIATPDVLYLADDKSCKMIDAATGKIKGELRPPAARAGGTVWKWMAIEDGVIYALLGGKEVTAPEARGHEGQYISGWPWAMWPGYDYKEPETAWGFGQTFLAMDPSSGNILWSYRDDEFIDARGVCLRDGRLYFCQPKKMLGCLDAKTGKIAWRTADAELLQAIGANQRAQHYTSGFATSCYIKTDGKRLLFAGPQRPALVCASAADGKLQWSREDGNFQLVLREDALYAAGEQMKTSYKIDYATGQTLAELTDRRACTRATGSIDSIFFRAREGTTRWLPGSDTIQHIAPMRPACHDGVIVSEGLLHWGPWICGCHLTLLGMICLGPAGDFDFTPPPDPAAQLLPGLGNLQKVKPFDQQSGDWPGYQGGPERSCRTTTEIAEKVVRAWTRKGNGALTPTAPVSAGGLVFIAGMDGVVRAFDAVTGRPQWQAHTGASILFPPEVWQGRVYAGSNDGRVYCFEAATGRELWRFRLGPADRKIPAYGELISTWPVAGGVAVADNGTLYAAAGISHFDGTHVYALDALTGKIKWYNNKSGALDPDVSNGISLSGNVMLTSRTLAFAGGNVYATAHYDQQTGECLNEPAGPLTVKRVFLHPRKIWEPIQGQTHATRFGQVRVSRRLPKNHRDPNPLLTTLGLYRVPPKTPAITRGPLPKPLWAVTLEAYQGSVVAGDTLLVLGRPQPKPVLGARPSLMALRIEDGQMLWHEELAANPVPWGIAVDAEGRIVVSLENGDITSFAPKQ